MEMSPEEQTTKERPEKSSSVSVWLNRIVLGAVALIAIAAIATVLWPSSSSDTALGDALDSVVVTEDGQTVAFSDVLDDERPQIINFYASWCAPCRAELPDFDEVSLRVSDEVQFVGVNADSSESSWKAFNEEVPVSYETIFQPEQQIREITRATNLPTTLFVSPDGEILRKHAGILDDDTLLRLINEEFNLEL